MLAKNFPDTQKENGNIKNSSSHTNKKREYPFLLLCVLRS